MSYKLTVSFATIFMPLTCHFIEFLNTKKNFSQARSFHPTYSSVFFLYCRSDSNNSNVKKQLLMNLMIVITYISVQDRAGKKKYSKQENLDLIARSLITHHTPNCSQAQFLPAAPPPQVNANYFQNSQQFGKLAINSQDTTQHTPCFRGDKGASDYKLIKMVRTYNPRKSALLKYINVAWVLF